MQKAITKFDDRTKTWILIPTKGGAVTCPRASKSSRPSEQASFCLLPESCGLHLLATKPAAMETMREEMMSSSASHVDCGELIENRRR